MPPNEFLSTENVGENRTDPVQRGNDDDHGDNPNVGKVLKPCVLVLAHGFLIVEKQDEEDQGCR